MGSDDRTHQVRAARLIVETIGVLPQFDGKRRAAALGQPSQRPALALKTPMFQASHSDRYLRQSLIKKIE